MVMCYPFSDLRPVNQTKQSDACNRHGEADKQALKVRAFATLAVTALVAVVVTGHSATPLQIKAVSPAVTRLDAPCRVALSFGFPQHEGEFHD
jgi:hypothetical protein